MIKWNNSAIELRYINIFKLNHYKHGNRMRNKNKKNQTHNKNWLK